MTDSQIIKELENLKSDVDVIQVISEIIKEVLQKSDYDERYEKSVGIMTNLLISHKQKIQDIIDNTKLIEK